MSTDEEKWDMILSEHLNFLARFKADKKTIEKTKANIANARKNNERPWCVCTNRDDEDVEPMISGGTAFITCNICKKIILD